LARQTRALRLGAGVLVATTLLLEAAPAAAERTDPAIATLLSAGSTVVPIALTSVLWTTGPGRSEDLRLNLGLVALGLGSILGPSIGEIYAGAGADAWVTFFLRAATGAAMLAGAQLSARADSESGRNGGNAVFLIAGIPTALLALYDIVAASSAAEETNRHRFQ
jgi:hypothetical protein